LKKENHAMKKTAFNIRHHQLGARMVEFAGFEMPLEYKGVIAEHLAVRNSVGIFDVSHMGEIWVKGPGAMLLLQHVTSNDINRLVPGKAQYSCFPNGKGGIVDDLILHKFDEESYLLVVNAANTAKDWNWLNLQNKFGAKLINLSGQTSQIAIQGPQAKRLLQRLTTVQLNALRPYSFVRGDVAGIDHVIIAATGYTGAGGYELYIENENPLPLWDNIFDAGKDLNIIPIGLAARDTLRLEMGYCLYGNDIDDTTSPIEAGLGWITKFDNNRDFIDRDLLLRQKNSDTSRKLVGFEMIDRGIPRQHYSLFSRLGERIGHVTSGTMSPSMKMGIGMGYVSSLFADPGNEILVGIRDKMLLAKVVRTPFIRQ
jgi:aminomethyltransferase